MKREIYHLVKHIFSVYILCLFNSYPVNVTCTWQALSYINEMILRNTFYMIGQDLKAG